MIPRIIHWLTGWASEPWPELSEGDEEPVVVYERQQHPCTVASGCTGEWPTDDDITEAIMPYSTSTNHVANRQG